MVRFDCSFGCNLCVRFDPRGVDSIEYQIDIHEVALVNELIVLIKSINFVKTCIFQVF